MKSIFEKIKEKICAFDLFALGNSVILYYLLIYYLVPFLILISVSHQFMWVGEAVSSQAMLYIGLGFLFLILGYYTPIATRIAGKLPNPLKKQWDMRKVPWVFAFVFVTGLVVKIIKIIGGGYFHLSRNPSFVSNPFYSSVGLLEWLGYVALVIAFASYFYLWRIEDKRYRVWRWIAYGTFAFEIAYAVPSCSKLTIIIPIILYLIVRSYLVKIEYWRIAVMMFAVVFLIFPATSLCRAPQLIEDFGINSGGRDAIVGLSKLSGEGFLNRLNHSYTVSKVLEHPEAAQYGNMVSDFFITLGPPRFLWKDKPLSSNAFGNEFGRAIGVVGSDDFETSVAPTIIGEWYINFGVIGIIIGMFLMGVLWRIVYVYFIERTDKSLSGILMYSIVWVQIVRGIEDWTAPVYAGLIKLLIILFVIHFLLIKKNSLYVKSKLS